ncbi:MAG: hypothetical protein ACREDP_09905, partial [Bradyrhizobium sp.]
SNAMLPHFAGVLSLVLMVSTAATAEPKLEMHRVGVNVADGSGWYPAVSTKGSFAILVPIPFNDFTTRDAGTDEVTHVVGGKSTEGIKFTAVETPVTAKTPTDLAAIPKTFSSNPANKVSDVSRNTRDDVDNLSFSVANPATTAHIRYIRTKATLYILTIEYPNAYRDLVADKKDKFFGSFKLKAKS